MVQIAFVIAHYHPEGEIGATVRQIVDYAGAIAAPVVLVSTHASDQAAASLPEDVTLIRRPNEGYDFYSYKIGLDALGGQDFDYVVLLNNSFVCLDVDKLMGQALAALDGQADVVGLTRSREVQEHLQSYWLAFSRRVLADADFRRWWHDMVPLSERHQVIAQYELGLSQWLLERGWALQAVYHPSAQARLRALCHAVLIDFVQPDLGLGQSVTLDLAQADYLNPTHFMWTELAQQLGLIKRELIERNPFRQPLGEWGQQMAALLPSL